MLKPSLQALIFTIVCVFCESSADLFSASYNIQQLVITQQKVIDDIQEYIHKEEHRLREIKLYLDLYTREQERAMQDVPSYVGNPINAFTLIKRLTADLDDIHQLTNQTTEFVRTRNVTVGNNNSSIHNNNASILYPTSEDLKGAALALRRLQKVYEMKVEDLARGIINSTINRSPLSASDCFELGVIIFRKKDYKNALVWHMEALRKFKLEENDDTMPRSIGLTTIRIMEYIGIIHYHMGDPETAADWSMQILDLDPDNKRAKKNIVSYELKIYELEYGVQEDDKGKEGAGDDKAKTDSVENRNNTETTNDTIHEDTCVECDENETETISENNTNNNKNSTNDEGQAKREKKVDESNTISDKKVDIGVQKDTISERDKKSELTKSEDNERHREAVANISVDASTKNETKENDTESQINSVSNSTTNPTSDETEDADEDETSLEEIQQGYIDLRRVMIRYAGLCRGDYNVAPALSARLSCRYLNDKSFLKLAPIKMEQLYSDPDVYIVYEVISDEEINHVISTATPSIRRSQVGDSHTDSRMAEYRISQNSWIKHNESETFLRVTQRISDFTGLSMKYAEQLQVANYGLGGQYEPHLDYSERPEATESQRIATVMFYMSEVSQGGATVFPKLGLSVFPVKGAAVYWPNLFPSGKGNLNTIHAGCPVLEGTKWVANEWVQLKGQEFIRPCNLEYEEDPKVPSFPESSVN